MNALEYVAEIEGRMIAAQMPLLMLFAEVLGNQSSDPIGNVEACRRSFIDSLESLPTPAHPDADGVLAAAANAINQQFDGIAAQIRAKTCAGR